MSRKPTSLKKLKKDAMESTATAIVNHMRKRGYSEVKITTKYHKQRGDIMVYVKPDPEVPAVCIAELNYDYPNAAIKEEIGYEVNTLVMEKLRKDKNP